MRIITLSTAMLFLAAATVPVAALTIVNSSTTEVTVGVDTGPKERIYTIAPTSSVNVEEDCKTGCSVTGPWGYSRAAKTGDLLTTDGTPVVTVTLPDKPARASASAAASANSKQKVSAKGTKKKYATVKTKKKKYAKKKAAKTASNNSPYFKGSFASLFSGKVE